MYRSSVCICRECSMGFLFTSCRIQSQMVFLNSLTYLVLCACARVCVSVSAVYVSCTYFTVSLYRHSNSSSVHHIHELGWQILHHHLFLHQRHHRCRHSPPKFLLLHQGCRRKIRAQFQLPLPAQCLLCSNKHLPVLALSPATAPQTVKTCWLINLGHRQATCHPAQQCLKTRRRSSRRLFG